MQMYQYMMTIVRRLTNPESGAKIRFCTWLLGLVHEEIGKLAMLFIFVMKHGSSNFQNQLFVMMNIH